MKIDSLSISRPATLPNNYSDNQKVQQQQKPQLTIKEQQGSTKSEIEANSNISKKELEQTIDGMNKFLEPSNTALKFQLHDKLNEYYVAIVDPETDEIIKEIPPKKFLDMYAVMLESIGLIVDHRI